MKNVNLIRRLHKVVVERGGGVQRLVQLCCLPICTFVFVPDCLFHMAHPFQDWIHCPRCRERILSSI